MNLLSRLWFATPLARRLMLVLMLALLSFAVYAPTVILPIIREHCELLAEEAEHQDRRATLAIDIFCYRVRKYIGAYLAALGGADAVGVADAVSRAGGVVAFGAAGGVAPGTAAGAPGCRTPGGIGGVPGAAPAGGGAPFGRDGVTSRTPGATGGAFGGRC